MELVKRALALLYGFITSLRTWLYDSGVLRSYRSRLPVISVGNITAGGNGKTPLCMLLVRELRSRGYRPVVLSRGYGGTLRGPHRVSASDTSREVGDEPVLMRDAGIPVFVSRSRVRGVRLIERQGEFNLVILDDGFQHRALQRDVDIVSIFAGSERAIEEFVAGALLPAGLFRERREPALRRASMIVVSSRSVQDGPPPEVDPRLHKLLAGSAQVFRSYLEPRGVLSLFDGSVVEPQPVCAVAAIANPEGFFQSLEHQGFSLVERVSLPDHHEFSLDEVSGLLARYPNTLCVCTAKDAVKLRMFGDQVAKRFAVLHVVANVVPRDAFVTQVERLIQRAV